MLPWPKGDGQERRRTIPLAAKKKRSKGIVVEFTAIISLQSKYQTLKLSLDKCMKGLVIMPKLQTYFAWERSKHSDSNHPKASMELEKSIHLSEVTGKENE